VIVFDPLAVILLLASQISFQSFREKRDWIDDQIDELNEAFNKPNYPQDDGPLTDNQIAQLKEEQSVIEEVELDWIDNPPTIQELDTDVGEKPTEEELNEIEKDSDPTLDLCYKCGTPLIIAPGIGPFCPNKECDVKDGPFEEVVEEPVVTPPVVEYQFLDEHTEEDIIPTAIIPEVVEITIGEIADELDRALSADNTTPITEILNETANQQDVDDLIANINPGAGIDHDSGAGIDHDSVEIHESGHDDLKGYVQNSEQQSSSLWSQITDKKTN
jgi:hypothetical protein